jgi:tetratricopeptide (TPR) repeat protein
MRQFLTILIVFGATICYSQNVEDIEHFYSVKNNNDSTLKYFMSFLNKFDSKDPYKNFFCEKASERVGDYYKLRQDYLKAIAYYDSADTKYRDKLQFCGNAYYIDFIPRRYKISQCYSELNNPRQTITTLTPYIFDNLGSEYFDSTMTAFYVTTLSKLYSRQEIENQLQNAINSVQYTTFYRWTRDSSAKYLNVSCKIKLFDTEIEMAGFETATDKGKTPFYATKEFFIKQFREFDIYKRLHD